MRVRICRGSSFWIAGWVLLADPPTWGSGFLPGKYQGTLFTKHAQPVEFITSPDTDQRRRADKFSLMQELNRASASDQGNPAALEARIAAYERAFRMQSSVPDLLDFSAESKETLSLYGIGEETTELFGTRCLLARRLVERGVRFVEVFPPRVKSADRWDQHGNLELGHRRNAAATDQPIAGLLKDLKRRGLLEETIVLWGGEFGRTPNQQGSNGRDHNPFGYTVWVAGGGFRPGIRYGETDDFGYHAVTNKVHLHDLHATLLHQLGIDHEQLTYHYSGRDFRLTDVAGEVVQPLLS